MPEQTDPRDRPYKPQSEEERRRKKASAEIAKRQRLKEHLWEKVEQHLKDMWRPYHGSETHVEDAGPQKSEKKKAGGHMPLNAAVMARWEPREGRQRKVEDSRRALGRELYRLAVGTPLEVIAFSEIRDLFASYGSGDSDLAELRRKALAFGPSSESAARLRAIETGIDLIVNRLIEDGTTNRAFWADFPDLSGPAPAPRTKDAQDNDRERYLIFVEECERLQQEGKSRYRNKALQSTADRCGVDKRTVQRAVEKYESGYIRDEAS